MTLENFKYRTDPLFLRHQFADHSGKYGIPMIPRPHFTSEELKAIPHKARLTAWRRICTTSSVRYCLNSES